MVAPVVRHDGDHLWADPFPEANVTVDLVRLKVGLYIQAEDVQVGDAVRVCTERLVIKKIRASPKEETGSLNKIQDEMHSNEPHAFQFSANG